MQIEKNVAGEAVRIQMRKPADMHQHLRDGAMLKLVAPMVAKRFSKAIVMPNLISPITSYEAMFLYRQRILDEVESSFWPLMTMYLTDELEPHELRAGLEAQQVFGVKYYPRGLTTNSDSGVKNPSALWSEGSKPYQVLRELADYQGVLLLHAADGFDKNGRELDPYEQEPHFISETLPRIINAHPELKISVEHLSTKEGARFMVKNGGEKLGCSITAHHLLLDRRDVFRGGFRPHRHWWPIIQAEEDKHALRGLVWNGLSFVWLGSDSAPHPVGKKETYCCAGGVLTAHAGIELYAEALEDALCLHNLEAFAAQNGPQFFGLSPSEETITLVREEWTPSPIFIAQDGEDDRMNKIIPFRLGEKIRWKLVK